MPSTAPDGRTGDDHYQELTHFRYYGMNSAHPKMSNIKNDQTQDTNTPDFWVRTHWPTKELTDKRVQFEFNEHGKRVAGIGSFRLLQDSSGEQRIQIVITTSSQWKRTDNIFTLRQPHADRIQRHPDPTVADFQLLA